MMEENSRDRILREATRLFGEHGYAGTSVRNVVDAAGVTKPTLYYYFANKSALFNEVVDTQLGVLRAMVDEAIHSQGTIRERLCLFVNRYIQEAMDDPAGVRLMMTASAPADRRETQFNLMEHFAAEISRLGVLFQSDDPELRPDADAEIAVAFVVGAADVILISALHGKSPPPQFAERIINLLFQGVKR